jgi:hypothetical protein
MRTALSHVVVAFACLVSPIVIEAQQPAALSVDVGLGAVRRTDILYSQNVGIALDVVAALPLSSALGGNLVAAASGGVDGFFDFVDRCRIDPPVGGTTTGCRPDFLFRHAALLAGWQRGETWRVRALAGPAYFGEFGSGAGAGQAVRSATAAAAEGRLDFGGPLFGPLGFSLTARAATLPNIRGRSVSIVAGTFGLRLHLN